MSELQIADCETCRLREHCPLSKVKVLCANYVEDQRPKEDK